MKDLQKFIPVLEELLALLKGTDSEFDALMALMPEWPEAVSAADIVDENSEKEKVARGDGIADLVLPPNRDVSILDVGCGEGHFVKQATARGYKHVVGCDVDSDWSLIAEQGPYDVVVLFDVLDHVVGETPVQLMQRVKGVCKPNAMVFVRCHPWCSRHGSHQYKTHNKAYLHLVFTAGELERLGIQVGPHQNVLTPRGDYEKLFKQSGFRIQECDTDRCVVEPWFLDTTLVRERILKTFAGKVGGFPQFQMEQSFLDYRLKPE